MPRVKIDMECSTQALADLVVDMVDAVREMDSALGGVADIGSATICVSNAKRFSVRSVVSGQDSGEESWTLQVAEMFSRVVAGATYTARESIRGLSKLSDEPHRAHAAMAKIYTKLSKDFSPFEHSGAGE